MSHFPRSRPPSCLMADQVPEKASTQSANKSSRHLLASGSKSRKWRPRHHRPVEEKNKVEIVGSGTATGKRTGSISCSSITVFRRISPQQSVPYQHLDSGAAVSIQPSRTIRPDRCPTSSSWGTISALGVGVSAA